MFAELSFAKGLTSPCDPKRLLEVTRRFGEFKRQALTPNGFHMVLEIGKEKRPYSKKCGSR